MDCEYKDQSLQGTDIYSIQTYQRGIEEQSFENHQYGNQNNINEQHYQGTTENKNQKLVYQQKDLKYKNFPKLIGNNLIKWVKKQMTQQKIQQLPNGIAKLMKSRERCNQPNFTIKDLQELCSDEASQRIFQEYIADELFLDLFNSNKIADPFSYIPGICNYFSSALEPHKMKSNYLTRKDFIGLPQQN